MARKYPGVEPIKGRPGWYRIRCEVKHPKTDRAHEIDRRISAESAGAAANRLASERRAWLEKHSTAAGGERRRLGDAMDAWLRGKRRLKPSTRSTYRSAVEAWRVMFGDYWTDAIDPRDVADAVEGWVEGGASVDTANGRLRVLRTFAREERCAGMVEGVQVMTRPVRDAERVEDEGRGLSLVELRHLLDKGPTARRMKDGSVMPAWRRAWALIATMAWTGLRFGEASALEWSDVDLENSTIRVRRAHWRGEVGHVKAVASKRIVVIPDDLVDVLREHRSEMLRRQQTGVSSPLVFPSRRSAATYVTNGHAGKAMLRACRAAGIDLDGRPWVHCLRHTYNNLLRQNASELVRQALIGHADGANNERYSKVGMDEKRAAVAGVVRMVREKL
jgi:integrase